MCVEINIQELLYTFESILQKHTSEKNFDVTQQVCGLSPKDYYRAINLAKYQTIEILPQVFEQLGYANCLGFVVNSLPLILKSMINEAAVDHTGGNFNIAFNFDKVLKLFKFAESLINHFGLNALKSIQQIMFADVDHFNVSTLILHLFRIIIVQRDQTVINLTSSTQNSGSMKIGKVFQRVSAQGNTADLS